VIHENFAAYEKLNLRGADESVARQETGGDDSNVLWRVTVGEGDVDAAWAECDVVVEGIYETHAQHHAYMEPCAALAEIDAGGRLTIHSPSQSVNQVQARVADALGLDLTEVRAISPRVGGAFGGKGGPHVQPIAAALARATGRTVKLIFYSWSPISAI
jgi:CO/xanthine dehydrogenase Mo-binding subunit